MSVMRSHTVAFSMGAGFSEASILYSGSQRKGWWCFGAERATGLLPPKGFWNPVTDRPDSVAHFQQIVERIEGK